MGVRRLSRFFRRESHPTITLSGDASGSATLSNLEDATMSITVADDSHTHDTRYYSETEVDGFLAAKSATGHTHSYLPLTGGTVTGTLDVSGYSQTSNIVIDRSGTTLSTPAVDVNNSGGAADYNYFLRASNDVGTRAVMFVNGSTRTADGGTNVMTIRNDGGGSRFGNSSYATTIAGSAITLENTATATNFSVGTGSSANAFIGGSNYWRPQDAYGNSYFDINSGSFYVDAATYYFRNASSQNRLVIDTNGNAGLYGGSFTAHNGAVVGGTFIGANGTDIYGTGGRNYFKDSEKSSGNGLRVGAAWSKYGIYSEDGDLVVGATTGTIRFGDNQGSYVSNSRIFWQTSYGNLSAGPLNTSWCHFETDRPKFYFNKGITVDTGYISSYNEDLELHRSGTKRLDITASENYFTGDRTVHSRSTAGSAYTDSQFQSYSGYGSGGVASWTGHIGGQLAPVFRVWTGTGEGFDCNNYLGSNYAYVGGSQFITRSSERFKRNIRSQQDEEIIPNIMGLLNCRTIKFDDKHVDPYWCDEDGCFKEVETTENCDCGHCSEFRADPIQRRHFGRRGYLVEELAEVYPTAVHFEADGKPSGIDYSAITVELIDAVKLLVLQGDEINRRLSALEAD